VVTTTWNEEENIGELVRRVRAVLKNVPHEVIVVDDSSTDDTISIAREVADLAVSKAREGQTKGLLYGMHLARFSKIVTIDADLENDPALIPLLIQKLAECDLVVASRTSLPRFSERLASKTIGKVLGVSDFFSNFRVYRKEVIEGSSLKDGETFGGELLVVATKKKFRLGEVMYEPPPRRSRPRIGGTLRANLRIAYALLKCIVIYVI